MLNALSFRVMVIDSIKRKLQEEQDEAGSVQSSLPSDVAQEIKEDLQKEVNKLMFQTKLEGATAVQDIVLKEGKKKMCGLVQGNNSGLNSSHHMAAEATIRRMREFVKKSKEGGLVTKTSRRSVMEGRFLIYIFLLDKSNLAARRNKEVEEESKQMEWDDVSGKASEARDLMQESTLRKLVLNDPEKSAPA